MAKRFYEMYQSTNKIIDCILYTEQNLVWKKNYFYRILLVKTCLLVADLHPPNTNSLIKNWCWTTYLQNQGTNESWGLTNKYFAFITSGFASILEINRKKNILTPFTIQVETSLNLVTSFAFQNYKHKLE